jgi:Tol biopolymer transport system component
VSSAAEWEADDVDQTDDAWQSVARLFTAALARDPADRAAFLEAAAANPDVRREVESLLRAHDTFGPLDRLAAEMQPLREQALAGSAPSAGAGTGPSPAEKRPSLEPGRRLGRYEIRSRLGAGGMGEVYRALDTRLQREVAVKVVAPRRKQRPGALERVEQEARAASALNHPNIITVFDIGEDASSPYIVMELIEGESLRRALEAPLSLSSLLDLAEQMASGLAAAHERGIVHRDLKPENILLTREGTLKILDFGLAQLHGGLSPLGEETATRGSLLGTLGYMSPELISGEPADFRSDQFSFGAILYEMATGRRAFEGRTPPETLALTLAEEPPPLASKRSVPAALGAIVDRCLRKTASDRYPSTRELLEAIRGVRRSQRRPQRGLAFTLAAAALLGAVAAGIGLWPAEVGRGPLAPLRLIPLTHGEGNDASPSLSPDGDRFVFASDRGGNWDLWVGRLDGGAPARITDTPEVERQPVWSPDGTRLAFVRRRLGESVTDIFVMPSSGGEARRLAERAIDPAWSSDSRYLAFSEFAEGWSRIARVTVEGSEPRRPVTEVEMDRFHRRPSWTPDGRTLVFNRSPGGFLGQIVRVSAEGGPIEPVTQDPDGTANIEAAVTPDGRYVVHVSDRGGGLNLWRIPVLGGAPERITSGPGQDREPAISPDGKRIAFMVSPSTFQVLEIPLASGKSDTLGSFEGSEPWGPDLSPDGKLVAFSQKVAGRNWRLTLMPRTGGPSRMLLQDMPDVFGVRFLPDGESLLFDIRRPNGGRIGTVRVDGSGFAWQTPEGEDATHPDVSPDGKLLTYVRARGPEVEIVLRPLEGGGPRVVVPGATLPRFSPDGRRLAFARSRAMEGAVGVVDLQGGEPRELTRSGTWPTWMPDGQTIAYADGSPEGDQTAWVVDVRGGPPRPLFGFRWDGLHFPFVISPDGLHLITTNSVGTKSTIWLAEF